MHLVRAAALASLACASLAAARPPAAPRPSSLSAPSIPDEDWGYVTVRDSAHMFWWLYGSTSTAAPRDATPTILWLQGGPGASSTGFGNFQELGPVGIGNAPRNSTWLQAANLLFVDQPVGTGYSYVDTPAAYVTNNTQLSDDVVALLTSFTASYPALAAAPFFIFCESYGGKSTVGVAQAALAAVAAGTLKLNLRGIALGDSWISPIDYVDAWGPYLAAVSLLDARDTAALAPSVAAADAAVAAGKWAAATTAWGGVEDAVESLTAGVSFYNVINGWGVDGGVTAGGTAAQAQAGMSAAAAALAPAGVSAGALRTLYARHVGARSGDPLADWMNGQVRAKLNAGPGAAIPAGVTWGGQSDAVFAALSGDFMRPVVDGVDALLAGGAIHVTVYNGQLDLICATPGTQAWMARLGWAGMPAFYASAKAPVPLPGGGGAPGAFFKGAPGSPLSMWYVLNAGHMVPADQGGMALEMVRTILAAQSA